MAEDLEIRVDRSLPVPLYHQLARELERAISDGRLVRGAFLENEITLAERWHVSRLTLRRAIGELVESGLLVRRRGVGTQVVSDQIPRPHRLGSLYDDLVARGETPRTTVLTNERIVADDSVAERLDLTPGSQVVYLERCRHSGARRLAILRDWVTVSAFGNITSEDLMAGGLNQQLRLQGVWPHSATRRVSARVAGPVDASLLGLAVGSPLLAVDALVQDTSGTRVNVSQQIHDGTDYTLELTVVEG